MELHQETTISEPNRSLSSRTPKTSFAAHHRAQRNIYQNMQELHHAWQSRRGTGSTSACRTHNCQKKKRQIQPQHRASIDFSTPKTKPAEKYSQRRRTHQLARPRDQLSSAKPSQTRGTKKTDVHRPQVHKNTVQWISTRAAKYPPPWQQCTSRQHGASSHNTTHRWECPKLARPDCNHHHPKSSIKHGAKHNLS